MRTILLAFAVALTALPALARVPDEGLLDKTRSTPNGGCVLGHCHPAMDAPTMHAAGTFALGCVDCHGGHPEATTEAAYDAPEYRATERAAHVAPAHPEHWPSRGDGIVASANPERSYTLLNRESADFIRFVNPSDLRVAPETCGRAGCHAAEVARVQTSMMTHGAMLWGAALYNNGAIPVKTPRFGESYALAADRQRSVPQRLQTIPQPTAEEMRRFGVLPFLDPLPRFELTQPGNILRVFERGDNRLSFRGLGTINRTDPVFQGLQRTRLLDPLLSFMGTNDHPGDYRASGCAACHVVYANDRDPYHSGAYARHGNAGMAAMPPPGAEDWRRRIEHESGHPVRHVFTRAVPTSQCVVCHMHPGTVFANAYTGYTWWDNETDGEALYPREARKPTAAEELVQLTRNPEAAALRGLWSDLYPDAVNHRGERAGEDFLARTWDMNPTVARTKFADYHGHGWLFRAVWKKDRRGNLLDAAGDVVPHVTPALAQRGLETPGDSGVPVHLKDIHLEKGMHCVDCHFEQDVHGNGKLYGETRNAIEIECVDCHGTVRGRATLRTSGPAAPPAGTDLAGKRTPWGTPVFRWEGDRLYQHAMLDPAQSWEVVQVLDSITPGAAHYNALSHLAKTLRADNRTWGSVPPSAPDVRMGGADPPRWGERPAGPGGAPDTRLAHPDDDLACYTCHSAWMTSCFGCHLPMRANQRRPMLHNEGTLTRNWTQYDFQVLRDDVFMLGRDGSVKRNRIVPVRSSSAVVVGSQNQNREWLYSQQQTVSAEGYSGQAFNPHFPHTVRATETKTCTDCHVARAGDNNAWMAQVLLQGTNFVNFLGRYVWIAEEDHGLEAVAVTEPDEPQAVIGSHLHRLAYPDRYAAHAARKRVLPGSRMFEHPGNDILHVPFVERRVADVQLRGEYLYAANGRDGIRVYDVADIDNKANAERITTSVLSPLGQRFYLRTRDAAAVVAPTTLAVDPGRTQRPENEEPPIHPLYRYLYVLDREEGLILVPAGTLLDGDPENNFLERARLADGTTAFNPGGALRGARRGTLAGRWLYVCTDTALVIVDVNEPLRPRIVAQVGAPGLAGPRGVAVQFRYAFVIDGAGLKVLDVSDPAQVRPVPDAVVPIADARDLYVARTYAYVAAGAEGLVIVDVERPEAPRRDQTYGADGTLNDATGVKVGMTNASAFAYVADGKNGLRVIQLTSPDTPGYAGFSPRSEPALIATYPTPGRRAVAVSKGLDRDRAVDESGNQVAVFGRRGAGPLDATDQARLWRGADGVPYTVPEVHTARDVERGYPDRVTERTARAR